MAQIPKIYVPPGGFLAQGGRTIANQLVATPGRSSGTRRRKRRVTRGAKRTVRRAAATRRTKRTSSPARMVKGSAAARRYMAKIRRMRKRK